MKELYTKDLMERTFGKRTQNDGWIKLTGEPTDELPEIDEPVWIQCNYPVGPSIFVVCRSICCDGWFWRACYSISVWKDRWRAIYDDEENDDDYQPVAWKRLPKPYTGE